MCTCLNDSSQLMLIELLIYTFSVFKLFSEVGQNEFMYKVDILRISKKIRFINSIYMLCRQQIFVRWPIFGYLKLLQNSSLS